MHMPADSAALSTHASRRLADFAVPAFGVEHQGTAAAQAAASALVAAKGGAAAAPRHTSRPVHMLALRTDAAYSSERQIDDRTL